MVKSKIEDPSKKYQPLQGMEGLPYRSIFEATADGLIISNLQNGTLIEANPAACSMFGVRYEELIGRPIMDFIEPSSQGRYNEFVTAVQEKKWSELSLTHRGKNDSFFSIEMRGTVINFLGQACLLSTIHDVSHWVRAEKTLQIQAEAHLREQSTLLEISQTLASTLELKPGIVLDQLRAVIEYSRAVRFELENRTLVVVAAHGSIVAGLEVPLNIQVLDPQIFAFLFNDRHPIRIDDVLSDGVATQLLRSVFDESMPGFLEGMRAWMWVPIALKGRLLGGLGIAHTQEGFFTAHHADLALTVANQAAIAMANAELYNHAQTLAALQERQRIARELHDAVNQSLFSAGLIAEVLPRLWETDPAGARQSLEDLRRLTHGAQADMRLLLAELRPNTLTDSDLGDLLRLLANAFTGRTNIPVEITIEGDSNLPDEVQLAFYRLSQEDFNNIARHAGAKLVKVLLHFDNVVADLHITDDGCGFDPEHIPAGHYGLSMMRERAEAVGASLAIKSEIGKGTEILIHWQGTPGEKKGGE